MPGGSFGRLDRFEHFMGGVADGAWAATGVGQVATISFTSVNEGSMVQTLDEPGGILAVTTDTGDNDNWFGFVGTFKPADGGMAMEARLKVGSVAAVKVAAWVGFAETLSLTTPVMPFETATTTTTYNGTGGMVGFGFDSDATAIHWRFGAGDGGAALANKAGPGNGSGLANGAAGTALGIIADKQSLTADRWWLFRVEVTPAGYARGYFSDTGSTDDLVLVGETTAVLGTTDVFHATVGIENRDGGAEVLELDYLGWQGWVDWAAN